MKTLNELERIAKRVGFEEYANFFNEVNPERTPEKCNHLILTATKGGEFDGEVIDILYDDKGVIQIDHSTQFKGQQAKFRFYGN